MNEGMNEHAKEWVMGQMSFSRGISVSEVGVIQEKPQPAELGRLCLAQNVRLGECRWSEKENISNMC